jgi:hypothetical protein
MKKLVLLAVSCVSFGSMQAVFMTTVELVMERVKIHSDSHETNYQQVESKLAARSHKSGYGRLFVLTPEILGEISAAPGVRVAGLMKSFLPMAQLYKDEHIIQYLYAHGAALEVVPEEEAGEGKEQN